MAATTSDLPPARTKIEETEARLGMPYIKISVSGGSDQTTEKALMEPIVIAIPSQLSLRIAAMHVMEFVMKEFKRIGFKDALKAIGMK